jgi:hypothetical protein
MSYFRIKTVEVLCRILIGLGLFFFSLETHADNRLKLLKLDQIEAKFDPHRGSGDRHSCVRMLAITAQVFSSDPSRKAQMIWRWISQPYNKTKASLQIGAVDLVEDSSKPNDSLHELQLGILVPFSPRAVIPDIYEYDPNNWELISPYQLEVADPEIPSVRARYNIPKVSDRTSSEHNLIFEQIVFSEPKRSRYQSTHYFPALFQRPVGLRGSNLKVEAVHPVLDPAWYFRKVKPTGEIDPDEKIFKFLK